MTVFTRTPLDLAIGELAGTGLALAIMPFPAHLPFLSHPYSKANNGHYREPLPLLRCGCLCSPQPDFSKGLTRKDSDPAEGLVIPCISVPENAGGVTETHALTHQG